MEESCPVLCPVGTSFRGRPVYGCFAVIGVLAYKRLPPNTFYGSGTSGPLMGWLPCNAMFVILRMTDKQESVCVGGERL